MIPVQQTKVSVSNSKGETVVYGNCYAAAIASMLELPITEVPNIEVFYHLSGDDYYFYRTVLNKYLQSKGYELNTDSRFKVFHDDDFGIENGKRAEYLKECSGQYYLASGKSPRGISHITIWKDGQMVHDPHPTKEGLNTIEDFQTLDRLTSTTAASNHV